MQWHTFLQRVEVDECIELIDYSQLAGNFCSSFLVEGQRN